MHTFQEFPLAIPLHQALGELDFHTPTPIQYESIPKLLDGQDLLGIAQTGTGKTAAFVLPLLHPLPGATPYSSSIHRTMVIVVRLANQRQQRQATSGTCACLRSATHARNRMWRRSSIAR